MVSSHCPYKQKYKKLDHLWSRVLTEHFAFFVFLPGSPGLCRFLLGGQNVPQAEVSLILLPHLLISVFIFCLNKFRDTYYILVWQSPMYLILALLPFKSFSGFIFVLAASHARSTYGFAAFAITIYLIR